MIVKSTMHLKGQEVSKTVSEADKMYLSAEIRENEKKKKSFQRLDRTLRTNVPIPNFVI